MASGNASKLGISKMHNVQETQKTVSKQTDDWVFATFIFAFLVDFAFEFLVQAIDTWEWYKKYISVKVSFSSKIIMWGFDALPLIL